MKKIHVAAGRRLLVASALLLTVALAGCDKTPKSAGDAVALNVGTLKIAALSNLYAAQKLGYFKKEGLAVTLTEMGGGAELLPAVSAGKIDISLSIPSVAIQAASKGFDFAMVLQNEVAAKEGADSQVVYVREDSGVASLAGLKGKTVAVNNIKSQMWLSFVAAAKDEKLGPQDFNFIELPFPNMQDALLNKQIDAAFNVEPFTSRMGGDKSLKSISYAATEALPGQPIGTFWASRKWLDANTGTAEKFVKAMNEATEYLRGHPEEAQKIIAEYTGMKLETIKGMRPILWDSKVDKPTYQSLIGLMKEFGLLAGDMSADAVLYPTALK